MLHLVAVVSAVLCVAILVGWVLALPHPDGMVTVSLHETDKVGVGVWVDRWSVGTFKAWWLDPDTWADAKAWARTPSVDRRVLGFRYCAKHDEWITTIVRPGVRGGVAYSDQFLVAVPALVVIPSLVAIPATIWLRTLHHRRRLRLGLCQWCGYDLRFVTERCPECGAHRNGTEAGSVQPGV